MALFLSHLTATQGDVLDDDQSGFACLLPGAYFPAADRVPVAGWDWEYERVHVGAYGPQVRHRSVGVRFGVEII